MWAYFFGGGQLEFFEESERKNKVFHNLIKPKNRQTDIQFSFMGNPIESLT